MDTYQIATLRVRPEWRTLAASWFHEKWGIPEREYLESIDESITGNAAIPQWYIAVADNRIIAGAGVIRNDFHNREDLSPNVCALYVESLCRRQGIARRLLSHIVRDMAGKGIDTLYLVTEHKAFYKHLGWEYLCQVQDNDGVQMRMYRNIIRPE